jgi:hypothetical protein
MEKRKGRTVKGVSSGEGQRVLSASLSKQRIKEEMIHVDG